MHADDWPVGPDLALSLIAAQLPGLAGLSVRAVTSTGTENVLYRLGSDLCARFPRTPGSGVQGLKETLWLSVLAPLLPLAIPKLVAQGLPGLGYPYAWSVTRWLEGEDVATTPPSDMAALARDLAGFVRALAAVPPELGGQRPPRGRGGPLSERDAFVRQMISAVTDEGDPAEWTAFWDEALALPPHSGAPVWLHGDLHGANLLAQDGRLAAVIDWGCLGLGDPAYDLAPAWFLFDRTERAIFAAGLVADDATWARARALAGSTAIMAIPYYRQSNPGLLAMATKTLARVLEDWRGLDCHKAKRRL